MASSEGTKNCQPVRGQVTSSPKKAVGGNRVQFHDPAVARVGFYQFANDEDMLDAYLSRMQGKREVAIESGTCEEARRSAPTCLAPGWSPPNAPAVSSTRRASPTTALDVTRAPHVYIGILGTSGDVHAPREIRVEGQRGHPGHANTLVRGID